MWLGRCACGRDIVVPTKLVEAIVRVRTFFRAQRLGPRPFQHPDHWASAFIGLMVGSFVGLVLGLSMHVAERRPFYLGDFVTAEHFNATAADLGCPQVDAVDGETLGAALRRLDRCLDDQVVRGDRH
jgi:hypothetical protein